MMLAHAESLSGEGKRGEAKGVKDKNPKEAPSSPQKKSQSSVQKSSLL